MYPTDKDFPTKEECNTNEKKNNKASSSSRPWAGDRDPRIIRASRSFGGKDRHSKVCTVKGLRDRRIRLSMPTAIQLYDLQDRLGLNQPSKVVDWLLNAAKHEIDKLPPLQIPQGNFGQYLQSIVSSHECVKDDRAHTSLLSSKEGIKINNRVDGEDHQTTIPKSTYWSLNSRADQCGEGGRESTIVNKNWIKRDEDQEQEQEDDQEGHRTQVSSNQVSPPGMLNNALPDTSYNHWEPSYLSLSHSRNQGYSYQIEDPHNYNYNVVPLPSSLSLPSGSQILLCPATTQSFFTPYVTNPVDCDPRQMNHFQMLSSSSQNFLPNSLTPSLYSINPPPMRPLQLSITPKLLHPQNNNGNQSNKVNNGDTSNTSTSDFFQNDPKASF